MQVNRVRGLYHHHKITPLECATLLRSPMYHTEVTESERTVLDRTKMKVKPIEVVTMKTAKEIMLESLKARDEEHDMDIDPPPIVVTPAEHYTMTPAALKYHQSINSKPKISVIRPAKKQQSVLDFI